MKFSKPSVIYWDNYGVVQKLYYKKFWKFDWKTCQPIIQRIEDILTISV